MQLDPDLTLEKAKTLSCQREGVREYQEILGSSTKPTLSLDQVSKSSHKGKKPPKSPAARQQSTQLCLRCGRGPHPHHQCPTSVIVHKGHSVAHCRSKSVADVADSQVHEEEFDDIAYLSTRSTQDANVWTRTIRVNNQDVSFKVDTGAEMTVISKYVSKALGMDALQPPTKKLYGPDQSLLEVVGETTVRLALLQETSNAHKLDFRLSIWHYGNLRDMLRELNLMPKNARHVVGASNFSEAARTPKSLHVARVVRSAC